MTFELEETRRHEEGEASFAEVTLVVVSGPSRGATAQVGAWGKAKVGSLEGSELRVDDRTVSRLHCEVDVQAARITLRDLDSKNGTFIDGVRVRDVDVAPGTVVRVGESSFRVDAGGTTRVAPISASRSFGELVGESVAMRLVYAVLERVAKTDATVLILGETGTGKDVAARSLHAASARAKGPFVAVDCGAIPEALFESELFGHVRGSFTGAVASRAGAFEEAHGGTLFLDEIGELPLALQAKLLRALETRTVRRVGAQATTAVDVRIVAATNRPLAAAVNAGTFRDDLYYRLQVVDLTMPPLRARPEDVAPLAQHFYERIVGPGKPLSEHAIAHLAGRAWPGNVRELRNAVERGVTLGLFDDAPAVAAQPGALPAGLEAIMPLDLPLKDAREAWTGAFETYYVRAMLAKTGGNVTRAAELAGVSRRFLQRTIARVGIKTASDDDDD